MNFQRKIILLGANLFFVPNLSDAFAFCYMCKDYTFTKSEDFSLNSNVILFPLAILSQWFSNCLLNTDHVTIARTRSAEIKCIIFLLL